MIRQTLLLFLIASTFCANSQNSLNTTSKIVFATFEYGENTRVQNLEPLARHISERSSISTQVKNYPSVRELAEGMKKGEVDIVLVNTAGYLLLKDIDQLFEPLVQLHTPVEMVDELTSVMVIGQSLEMKTLEDVLQFASDFVLVLGDRASTSGDLAPRLKLSSVQPGIPERFFLEVQYTNNDGEAIQRATSGEYALCSISKSSYLKLSDASRLKVLWESPMIPGGPVLFRKDMPGSLKEELEKAFLDMHISNQEILQSLKDGWKESANADRFIQLKPESYDALLDLSVNRQVASFIIQSTIK